ncbi:MAG: type VII toxin-antitoxin system HepT family RNase toxin [Gammaproteobacteria bacterium]
MDREVILEKLEALRHCIRRVESKRPASAELLLTDWDLQDIITLNLTRAVQLCVDIASHIISCSEQPPPDSMGAAFENLASMGVLSNDLAVKMKKAVGFRNVAVHHYEAIDWQIVFSICWKNVEDFVAFAKAVNNFVEGES